MDALEEALAALRAPSGLSREASLQVAVYGPQVAIYVQAYQDLLRSERVPNLHALAS